MYHRLYPLRSPAYAAARVAARFIRDRGARYFSGRLLDIGCGTKAKIALVGDLVSAYVGLDHAGSPHGLENLDLVGSAYEIPAESESFDAVLCTAVLEHLEDPALALREAHRVLRPGGYAVYTAPLFWYVHEEPRDFFRYTRYGLQHLFANAGFEVVEVTAMAGFWTMAAAQFGSYLQRFRRGPLSLLVDACVVAANLLAPRLDVGPLRDERFAWMYIVVARRPDRFTSTSTRTPADDPSNAP